MVEEKGLIADLIGSDHRCYARSCSNNCCCAENDEMASITGSLGRLHLCQIHRDYLGLFRKKNG